MEPPTVLSNCEEQVLVKWITDCPCKGFPQRKLVVQFYVKELLTVNHRHTFKRQCAWKWMVSSTP